MSYPLGLDSGLSASREGRDSRDNSNNQSRGGNRGYHNYQRNDGRDAFGREQRDAFGREHFDRNDNRGTSGDRRRYSGGDYDDRRRFSNERNDYHQYHRNQHRSPNYRGNSNRNNRYHQGGGRDNKGYRARSGQKGRGRGRGGRGRGKPRVPGNIVQKSNVQSLPDEVGMGKALLTALCDYTLMETTDDIPSNILQLAEVFISSGDLDSFADEYSDLFVKSFGQLSIQVPIVSTLLALISKSNREFVTLVLDKLCFICTLSITEGDILVSKLTLRCLASLCSCNVLAVQGEGGLISIITPLLALMDQALAEFKSNSNSKKKLGLMQTSSKTQIQGSVACYLVASTIPFCADILNSSAPGKVLLLKCASSIREVEQKYKSPFDVGGTHAVVHENVMDEAAAGEGPDETSTWDNLWSACHAATESINLAMKTAGTTTNTNDDVEEGATTTGYNKSPITFDGLLVMPWLDNDVKAALAAEPVVMVKKEKDSKDRDDGLGLTAVSGTAGIEDDVGDGDAFAATQIDPGTAGIEDDGGDGDAFAATQIDPDIASSSDSNPVNNAVSGDTTGGMSNNNNDDDDDDDDEELVQVDVPFHITLDTDVAQNIADAITSNSKPAFGTAGGAGYVTLPSWLAARFAIFDAESWPAECAVPMGWRSSDVASSEVDSSTTKDNDAKKGLSGVQLHFILEYLRDVLRFFDVYTKDDGTKVGNMDIQMKHCMAIESLLTRENKSFGIKGLLIELLLNKCVQSGISGGDSLLHSRLLVEMVKKDQESVPSILAAGAGVLYRLVPAMDTCAWREVAQWVTYHLVNFRLAWPYWAYWAQDFKPDSEDSDEVTRRFIRQVVDKTTRLLFPERVRQHIPGDLYDCIPDCQKIEPQCPAFITDTKTNVDPDEAETKDANTSKVETIATQILQHVEARDDNEDMKEFLDTLSADSVTGYGEEMAWKAKFLLMACLVDGKKAPSAVFTLFDKYNTLLQDLISKNNTDSDTDVGETELLTCIVGCYPQDMGTALVFVRAAMDRKIISPHIVAKWASANITKQGNSNDLNADIATVDMSDYDAVLFAVNYTLNQVRITSVALRNLTAESEMDTEEEPNKVNIAADMSGAVTNIVGGRAPAKSNENEAETVKDGDGDGDVNTEGDEENHGLNTSRVDEQLLEKLVDATKMAIDEAHTVFSTLVPIFIAALHTRYTSLGWTIKTKAKRSRDTFEEEDVYHLDSYNVTVTSLLKHILRLYRALEQEVDSDEPLGDTASLFSGAGIGVVKSVTDLPTHVTTSLLPYLSK